MQHFTAKWARSLPSEKGRTESSSGRVLFQVSAVTFFEMLSFPRREIDLEPLRIGENCLIDSSD